MAQYSWVTRALKSPSAVSSARHLLKFKQDVAEFHAMFINISWASTVCLSREAWWWDFERLLRLCPADSTCFDAVPKGLTAKIRNGALRLLLYVYFGVWNE